MYNRHFLSLTSNRSKGYENKLDTFGQNKLDVPGNLEQKCSCLTNMMPRSVRIKCCKMDLLKRTSAMTTNSNSSLETNKTHCQATDSSPRALHNQLLLQRSASKTLITIRVRAFIDTTPKGSIPEKAKKPVQNQSTPAITHFISRLKSRVLKLTFLT